jgi:hypothetical protein
MLIAERWDCSSRIFFREGPVGQPTDYEERNDTYASQEPPSLLSPAPLCLLRRAPLVRRAGMLSRDPRPEHLAGSAACACYGLEAHEHGFVLLYC